MKKEIVNELNEIAQEDFEKAAAMLEGINMVLGTKYGWLNRRVVFFDYPDCSYCIKYRNAHDLFAWSE